MLGESVGKYRVVSRLGRGGMGTVYKAVDRTLDREVAIKCLNADLGEADLLKRFRAEAIALARLNHPNIATLYELAEHDGQLLMVMEYVRGETFDKVAQREGMMSVARAAQLCGHVLDALEHAHGAGVVHRDLKPANLMLTDSGVVKVMDFGLARIAGTEHLTSAGFMVGTPAYMAPEQVLGREIDGRADLYAMGVVLFRLLTAQLPFKADSGIAMVQSQLNEPPTPVRQLRSELPLACEAFLQRALAKSPDDRFQTTAEFRAALSQLNRLPGSELTPAAPPSSAAALTLPPTPTPMHPTEAGLPPKTVVAPIRVPPASPPEPPPASDATANAPMSMRPAAVSSAPQPIVPPPVSAAPPTSRVPIAAVAAGAVLLLTIAGGAMFMFRNRTAAPDTAAPDAAAPVTRSSPAAVVPAAPVTTAAASTAPASPPAPTESPVTPASRSAETIRPPAAAPPSAAKAAAHAKLPAADKASEVKPDPAPAPPVAPVAAPPESTAKPAAPEPRPPAPFAPVTLEDVTWWEIDGVKTHEREISLVLGPERIAMMEDEETRATVSYHDIIGLYTSRSREPRYVEGGETRLVIAVGRGVFGLFKVGTPTWLTLRTARGFYPMQLSGEDRERLIHEIEARAGAKLQVAK